MIQLTQLELMRGSKVLLKEAQARFYPGHKIGLVGPNGCGKSSLFALLRGLLSPDQGQCDIPADWRIASVAQETPASERRALDYVIDGDCHLRSIQAQLSQAEQEHDGEAMARLHGQLEQAGGYDVEARAATILAGLGFSQAQLNQPVSAFSGGWRMRLNLAQALVCKAELLLLDEPTNHLDLDAVLWLEKFLQQYEGTMILISHDKSFLDATVTEVCSFEHQQLVTYSGNYSGFERQRAERARQQDIQYQKQQAERARLQSFVDRFRAKATKAKQAQSRVKQLEKMETLLPAHQDSEFAFEFQTPPKLPNPLVAMEDVQAGYGDTLVLEHLQMNLVPGSRIGLLGRNGAGKSTLVKLLAEQMPPLGGKYTTSSGLRIGYFAQHQLEYLQLDESPLQHLQRLDPKATEQALRDYLGGFGFHGDKALATVAPMSGGEKARLVLAFLVYTRPNLLLLDEPTNHLDLEMRHALNLALQGFEGALVLVSHDRYLLDSVCDEYYLVADGQVSPFKGDLEDYRRWLMEPAGGANQSDATETSPRRDRKAEKRLQAERRQQTRPVRQVIEKLESKMEKASGELSRIEQALTDTSLYDEANKTKLKTLLEQQAAAQKLLEEAEQQWLEQQERLQQLEQDID